jgi:hypothetical protein
LNYKAALGSRGIIADLSSSWNSGRLQSDGLKAQAVELGPVTICFSKTNVFGARFCAPASLLGAQENKMRKGGLQIAATTAKRAFVHLERVTF